MKFKKLLLMAVASLAVWQVATGSAADIEGDQFYVGDATIAFGDTVNGNVAIIDGTLTVRGTVEGNIDHRRGDRRRNRVSAPATPSAVSRNVSAQLHAPAIGWNTDH